MRNVTGKTDTYSSYYLYILNPPKLILSIRKQLNTLKLLLVKLNETGNMKNWKQKYGYRVICYENSLF